jgi:hypothetical protein
VTAELGPAIRLEQEPISFAAIEQALVAGSADPDKSSVTTGILSE